MKYRCLHKGIDKVFEMSMETLLMQNQNALKGGLIINDINLINDD
jgi:hypothetical protein